MPIFLMEGLLKLHWQFYKFCETNWFYQGDKRLLPQLFSAVVSQLNRVVDAYRLAAKAGQRAVTRNKADPVRLDLADVWSKVQSVIQVDQSIN